ncbi:hypothetical protein GE09DRAFT_1214783 [Coniochaeta sp. 2T2.1]|nr:hypothetical protein GE09DRAFT_1214783 [Coniochaeta sp. 2T2.1]
MGSVSIPQKQTAVWIDRPNPEAKFTIRDDVPVPTPGEDDVLVKIEYSGLCHSDVSNMMGHHPMTVHIPGHEGVGHIVSKGSQVPPSVSLGQLVGIKWIHSTCHACAICERDGDETLQTNCPNQHNSGRDRDGTLQQYVVVPARHASPIPEGLSSEVAAPLLCAGLTLYSAVGKSRTRKGDWIVISGGGGGLGHIGVQVAVRRGLKVIAIDSEDKRQFCCEKLGATAFFDFRDADLEAKLKALTGGLGAHAAICTSGSEAGYTQAVPLLRPGGTLVCVGLPSGGYTIPLRPADMVNRGLHVIGSAVGNETELQELLRLAAEGAVVPEIKVMPLSEFGEAMEVVKESKIAGKIVIKMP